VIGILKAFLGLSGSFFTTVYVSFLDPNAISFLLMLAIVPSAIVLACTLFINYVPYIQIEPHTKVGYSTFAHLLAYFDGLLGHYRGLVRYVM